MSRATRAGLLLMSILLIAIALAACGDGESENAPAEQPTTEAAAPADQTDTEAAAPADQTDTEAAAPADQTDTEAAAPADQTDTEAAAPAEADVEPSPEPAEETTSDAEGSEGSATPINVAFLQPSDNAIIPITSTVVMSATGVTIAPAGQLVEGQVHLHILINAPFIEAGNPIPNDAQHLHFGDGSTTTELVLPVGSHTLRLQAADGAHVALAGEEYRDEIVVSVADDAPAQAVRFAMPSDGATVPPSFDVAMAATGLIVEPAGPINANAGHFHILIDTDFIEPGNPIPNDEAHLHFGKGQLTTTLGLEPGEHLLRLQMADGAHVALEGEEFRDTITVTVAADTPAANVKFVAPADGELVTSPVSVNSPVSVKMSAAGLIVERSGGVLRAGAGHMHILVDTDFIEAGNVIPADDNHIHFGGGQLTTTLDLAPGEHVLRLQMANGAHLALEGEQYRDEITVTVAE